MGWARISFSRRWFGSRVSLIERSPGGSSFKFEMARPMPVPAPYWVHAMVARYHRNNPVFLSWYIRLGGWLISGVPLAFLDPRLVPAGVLAFEVVVYVLGRVTRPTAEAFPGEPPSSGPPDAGDREPLYPLPGSGNGSVAVPLDDM
jgi:hypothetical protein